MKFIVLVIKHQKKKKNLMELEKDQARKSLKYEVRLCQSKRGKCKEEEGGKLSKVLKL